MKLKSEDFEDNNSIPSEFTCDGRDISPQLSWEDVPPETRSFALSVTDPDAPGGTWIHWLVYDIPSNIRSIKRNSLPKGAREVENNFGKEEYGGPCPPYGTHRYFFKVYALDTKLNLDPSSEKKDVEKAMENHILAEGELVGLYRRQQ